MSVKDGATLPPTDLIERRPRARSAHSHLQFYALGIDGVFSDFPDTALTARALFRLQNDEEYDF